MTDVTAEIIDSLRPVRPELWVTVTWYYARPGCNGYWNVELWESEKRARREMAEEERPCVVVRIPEEQPCPTTP